jgi:hypothetical protein
MGDRAVFGFRQSGSKSLIMLYAHWDGSEQETLLAEALNKAEPRWFDEYYATRIMTSSIIGTDWDGEHHYGLYISDKVYPNPSDYNKCYVVDFRDKTVNFVVPSENLEDSILGSVTFSEFVKNPFQLMNSLDPYSEELLSY